MEALNPSTGQFEKVYVKALDSMPVGSVVNFTGSSADVPAGWEEVNDYSTIEIDTGKKWIDGKPIYRKVISSTLNGTYTESGNRFTWIPSNLSNVNILKIDFIATLNDRYLTNIDSMLIANISYISTGSNANKIQVGSNVSGVAINTPIYLILEYTKTS